MDESPITRSAGFKYQVKNPHNGYISNCHLRIERGDGWVTIIDGTFEGAPEIQFPEEYWPTFVKVVDALG